MKKSAVFASFLVAFVVFQTGMMWLIDYRRDNFQPIPEGTLKRVSKYGVHYYAGSEEVQEAKFVTFHIPAYRIFGTAIAVGLALCVANYVQESEKRKRRFKLKT